MSEENNSNKEEEVKKSAYKFKHLAMLEPSVCLNQEVCDKIAFGENGVARRMKAIAEKMSEHPLDEHTPENQDFLRRSLIKNPRTYHGRRSGIVGEFLSDLMENYPKKYDEIMWPSEGWDGVQRPIFLNNIAGPKTPTKTYMFNAALIDWNMMLLNKKRNSSSPFPFLQPSSQNVKNKMLVAELNQVYGFQYTLLKDFNFIGGFGRTIVQLYAERLEKYGMVRSIKYV